MPRRLSSLKIFLCVVSLYAGHRAVAITLKESAATYERLLFSFRNEAALALDSVNLQGLLPNASQRRERAIVHFYERMLRYSMRKPNREMEERVIGREEESWLDTIGAALKARGFAPRRLRTVTKKEFVGFELSRERINQLQPLVTRWIPQEYHIVHQPFALALSQDASETRSSDKLLRAPIWFPFFPDDFDTVTSILREAVHIRMHLRRGYQLDISRYSIRG